MKPTLEQCLNQARSLLGDDDISGGEVFTDVVLEPHAYQAIRELFRVLRQAQDPFVLTEGYFVLPSNTSVFDPATAGFTNMAEPEFVEWTLAPTTTAITNVVMTTGDVPYATVTAPGHGLAVSTQPTVVVYGVQGFDEFNTPNQSWSALVVDANTIRLNGCTAAGTYTSDGYLVGISTANQFIRMSPRDRIMGVAGTPADSGQTDAIYAWEGGVFRFVPSAQGRLLRVTYRISGLGTISTTAIIPIDDCQDYLATRTASLAAPTRGASQRGAELKLEAVGPTGQADGSGGILGQLLRSSIRNMQRIQYRYKDFRARRNNDSDILF